VSSYFDVQLFLSVFVTLLVIMNPPGAVPIFLGLKASLTHRQRVVAARRASLVGLGVIAAFAVFGQQILTYLHISLPALQGAGGLLLLLVALQLLVGQESGVNADAGVNVALVPLGTPILAGPGAIVATILAVRAANGVAGFLAVAVGLVIALLIVWLFLRRGFHLSAVAAENAQASWSRQGRPDSSRSRLGGSHRTRAGGGGGGRVRPALRRSL
jgi:multiple antibiotic resistance protein